MSLLWRRDFFFFLNRRRKREEFVEVWILREEGSVFLGDVSVACPCV